MSSNVMQTIFDDSSQFLLDYFDEEKEIPSWVLEALEKAEIKVKCHNGPYARHS
jgi:hypothetical protein